MFAQILFCNLIKFVFSQLALRWRHIVDVAVAIAVTKVEYHPIANQIPAPIQVSLDKNDIINRQANPESSGNTGYSGTLKPPSFKISSRLRSGMIPNETMVNASSVPMLTRLVRLSSDTKPPITAIKIATAHKAIFGVCDFLSSWRKEVGKRPSRLSE